MEKPLRLTAPRMAGKYTITISHDIGWGLNLAFERKIVVKVFTLH